MKIARLRKLSRKSVDMSHLVYGFRADHHLSEFIFIQPIEGPDILSKTFNKSITLLVLLKKCKMMQITIQSLLSRKPNRFRFDKRNGRYYSIHRGPEDIANIICPDDVECSDLTLSDYIYWKSYNFKKGVI